MKNVIDNFPGLNVNWKVSKNHQKMFLKHRLSLKHLRILELLRDRVKNVDIIEEGASKIPNPRPIPMIMRTGEEEELQGELKDYEE